MTSVLQGPEQVFRFTLTKAGGELRRRDHPPQAGVKVEPRIVEDGDENRLTGYAALPTNLNPYLAQFGNPVLAAARSGRWPGATTSSSTAPPPPAPERFTFRFWVNDTRPPSLKLTQARVRRNLPLVVRASDLGSGIDATTIKATIDGRPCQTTLAEGNLRIRTIGVKPGKHRLRLQVSDYQESRNMENVAAILPNTRVLSAAIVLR